MPPGLGRGIELWEQVGARGMASDDNAWVEGQDEGKKMNRSLNLATHVVSSYGAYTALQHD